MTKGILKYRYSGKSEWIFRFSLCYKLNSIQTPPVLKPNCRWEFYCVSTTTNSILFSLTCTFHLSLVLELFWMGKYWRCFRIVQLFKGTGFVNFFLIKLIMIFIDLCIPIFGSRKGFVWNTSAFWSTASDGLSWAKVDTVTPSISEIRYL